MSDLIDKYRRQMVNMLPGPPKVSHTLVLGDPAYHDPSMDEAAAMQLLRQAVPDGWRLVQCRRVMRGKVVEYWCDMERQTEVRAPFSVEDVEREYALLEGDWEAVAAVLQVSYREFRRWLTLPAFAALEERWAPERDRVRAREAFEPHKVSRGTYSERRLEADLAELKALRPRAPGLVDYVIAQLDNRSWPPVAVLRRYVDTGEPRLLEHLRSIRWAPSD